MTRTVVSKRLEIKPGCVRSVHTVGDRGRWVVKVDGDYKVVTGNVNGNKFIADKSFTKLIRDYKMQRENFKGDGIMVQIKPTKHKTGQCVYEGEIRSISYTRKDCLKGRISWKGEIITVKYHEGKWVKA